LYEFCSAFQKLADTSVSGCIQNRWQQLGRYDRPRGAVRDGAREVYGYGIRRETHRRTHGLLAINEGALYPLLHTLERRNSCARAGKGDGALAEYYHLTEKGRRELERSRREWTHLLKSLKALLR